jgi:type I restriction enzyme S subunit
VADKKNKSPKQGWRHVRFGEVVQQCKEKADPETSGLERYIAGDHMDTDDLRLRRWGEIGSGYLGPAFHIRFKPGQVLYGSRRTYLRKVAVAAFEGICANTTFVLEPKNPRELLPEFLPFLMQTEAFNAFSVKNSKGSVNPYINFSDLERFEFSLPPAEEQWQLTRVLQGFDDLTESLIGTRNATKTLKFSLTEDAFPVSEVRAYFNDQLRYGGRSLVKLGELASLQVGFPFKSAEYSSTGDRLLRGSNVGVNRLLWESDITCYWPTERRHEVPEYVLNAGDVVIAMDRPFIAEGFKIARVAQADLPALLLQRVGRFRLTERITPEYLWAFLHSESFKWQLQRMQKGTDLPHISKFDIEGTFVPALTVGEQVAIAESFGAIADAEESLLNRASASLKQRKAALHALVGWEAQHV